MAEWSKAHDWKSCEVKSLRRFKSSSLRQKERRSNTSICVLFFGEIFQEIAPPTVPVHRISFQCAPTNGTLPALIPLIAFPFDFCKRFFASPDRFFRAPASAAACALRTKFLSRFLPFCLSCVWLFYIFCYNNIDRFLQKTAVFLSLAFGFSAFETRLKIPKTSYRHVRTFCAREDLSRQNGSSIRNKGSRKDGEKQVKSKIAAENTKNAEKNRNIYDD